MSEYSGHKTLANGSRVALTSDEAKQIWEATERSRAKRAEKLPDQETAIRAMFEAHTRLKELGWGEAMYCPKDGTHFQVIENGSTGIFDCVYEGQWPDGHWIVFDDRDCYPSSTPPALFRLYPEDEARHKARMTEAVERFRREQAVATASDTPPPPAPRL